MGQRFKREWMLHYINTNFGTHDNHQVNPNWELLGEDLEEYSIEMNPNISIEKDILGRDYIYHDGYEPTASVSPYFAREGSALSHSLQDVVDMFLHGDACITDVLEVHLFDPAYDSSTPPQPIENTYIAIRKRVCVGIDSFGGDYTAYQIPFTLTYLTDSYQRVNFNIRTNTITRIYS